MILHEIVAQGDPAGGTLAAVLGGVLAGKAFDRLDVAVAYATRSGLDALREAAGGWPAATRWVVGLDDAITQPDAIDDLLKLPNAEVRLASLASEGRRYHPKLYCFWSSQDAAACVAVVGSANMTLHGLNRNGEVAVVLVAESAEDTALLKAGWNSMSALGKDIAAWDLAAYREAHARARKARRRMQKIGAMPPQPEAEEDFADDLPAFDGDPATATVAWTEGASPSAGGLDLEFPKPMMPFFGLTASPETRSFQMAGTTPTFHLTFTRRKNKMWRLLFSADAVQAAIGRHNLRPLSGVERSDLAIVFRKARGAADYKVRMVVIGSPEHAELIARSEAVGGRRRTRDPGGRYYGFY
jgi:PLD-like domain